MKLELTEDEARQLNPLNLAFIGDSVWESFVRDQIFPRYAKNPPTVLHKICVGFVKAEAQSDAMEGIQELLTGEETTIFKRGRNQKSGHAPRNAVLSDYKRATGFEALLGYLYLTGQVQRLEEIMTASFAWLDRPAEACQEER